MSFMWTGLRGTVCPDCGRVTETVSEENYFFKLSAFERKLLEFYEANPGFMGPESTRREVISFVRGGLKDLSVSRTSFSWGIPVPGDEKHVIYVWLDALANYITALGYGSEAPEDQARFAKFWPADMHLIGKEISRFHCVYWPAFLMAAGIPLPRSVRANGWLLFDQGKMSKSRGNIVRAETVQEVLGADALRYFLLREIPFGQDGSFTFDALVQRYNGDLANGYGNLVSRVVNMVHKYFGGVVPEAGAETAAEAALREAAERTIAVFGPSFDDLNFSEALKALWVLVAETDGYLTANAPWKKPADRSEADHAALQARVLATAAEAIRIITALVYPILPDSAAKVWRQLGQGEIDDALKRYVELGKVLPKFESNPITPEEAFLKGVQLGRIEAGTKFGEPAPLFPRAEKEVVERMQKIEEENSKTVIEAAGGGGADGGVVQSSEQSRLQCKRVKHQRQRRQLRVRARLQSCHNSSKIRPGLQPLRYAPWKTHRRFPFLQQPRQPSRYQTPSLPPFQYQPRLRSQPHRRWLWSHSTSASTTSPRWSCAWRRSWWPSGCPRPTSCCGWRSIWAMRSGRFWPASRNTTSRKNSLAARS